MSIQEELGRLREEMRDLRQRTARAERAAEQHRDKTGRLEETVKRLTEENKKLNEEKASLEEEIASLKAHQSKLISMLFKKNAKASQEESVTTAKKSRGGQTGHVGHGKKSPVEVDEEKNVHLTHCLDCENPLNESDAVYARIIQDIPDPSIITTRYLIQRQWCTHCKKEVHAIPENTIPGIHIGLRAVILICLLKYRQRIPLAKIVELLKTHHGLSLTEGGIQKLLRTLSQKFAPEYEQILREIRAAPEKHADETTWRIEGMNHWCWLFATTKAALYTIEESRGKGVPDRVLGKNPTGVLIRDDYAGYTHLTSMEHQSCWSHLLRVSHEATKQPTVSEDMKKLHEELKRLFVELKQIVAEPFDAMERREKHAGYTEQLRTIEDRVYTAKDVLAVQTRIRNQGTNLITALLHEHVPLTNNHAERQIRPIAVIRKISGGSRSCMGSTIQAVNMSIMQTIALRGQDYVTELRRLLLVPAQRFVLERGE